MVFKMAVLIPKLGILVVSSDGNLGKYRMEQSHSFLQGFPTPNKFVSKIVSPYPFASPTEISEFGPPLFVVPPIDF